MNSKRKPRGGKDVRCSDLVRRLNRLLKQAVRTSPRDQASITAVVNKHGEVVIVTNYRFLYENSHFEPEGFLTSLSESLPSMMKALAEA